LHRGAEDLRFSGVIGIVVEYRDAEPLGVARLGRRQGVDKRGLQQELAWSAEQHSEMTECAGRIPMQAAQARSGAEKAVLVGNLADLGTRAEEAERYRRIEARACGELLDPQASIVKMLGKTQRCGSGNESRPNEADNLEPERVEVIFGQG
jgi:hypothetical protein